MKTPEILLVEDNPDDVELTLRALRKYKVANRIEVVRDGEEALNFLFCQGSYSHRTVDEQPRLILLDINLPKVNGLEVLQRILQEERTKSIPVVLLTASQEEKHVLQGYRLGGNSYVVKPLDFTQFVEAVGRLGLYWMLLNKPPNS